MDQHPMTNSQRARPPRPDEAASPSRTVRGGWRFVVLVSVANYGLLRRHLGLAVADSLADLLVRRIAALGPAAAITATGRDLIELIFVGDHRAALDERIGAIERLFARPLPIDIGVIAVDVHIGASAAPVGEADDVRLIEEAETALIEARSERQPVICDVACGDVAHDRMALAHDLPVAIRRGEMALHYQPKLHVRHQRISSVEALVRWNHPTRGQVSPGDFIPLAEQSRDIVDLTLWTIRQVIEDQRLMASRGVDCPIFINIAGVLLTDTAFVREACALIQGSGARLGFEVTETSVIRDPQCAIAHLQIFAGIGITIAIDDYGAGLSSLAYLKQLPARELKIDKLFVTQLTSSNRDPLIVRSTIDLAHALEMEVVAEGVETHAALALLSVMGCDMVQGFLISRPVPLDALLAYLEEQRGGFEVPVPPSVQSLRNAWSRR